MKAVKNPIFLSVKSIVESTEFLSAIRACVISFFVFIVL
jgi:hypothetical protein